MSMAFVIIIIIIIILLLLLLLILEGGWSKDPWCADCCTMTEDTTNRQFNWSLPPALRRARHQLEVSLWSEILAVTWNPDVWIVRHRRRIRRTHVIVGSVVIAAVCSSRRHVLRRRHVIGDVSLNGANIVYERNIDYYRHIAISVYI